MEKKANRFGRRTIVFFWLALVTLIIGVLLYIEQIAMLYVLATLGLIALLLIVAFADLEHVGRANIEEINS